MISEIPPLLLFFSFLFAHCGLRVCDASKTNKTKQKRDKIQEKIFQVEPNSFIHFSHLMISAAETELFVFRRASRTSSIVMGASMSSATKGKMHKEKERKVSFVRFDSI
jgi:hypothetical protein